DHLAAGDRQVHFLDHLARAVGLLQPAHLQPADGRGGIGGRAQTAGPGRVQRRSPSDGVLRRRGALAADAGAAEAGASRGASTARTRPPGLASVAAPPWTLNISAVLSQRITLPWI